MKIRRLLIVMLVLIISLGCASIIAFAEETSSKIKLEWEISEIKAKYESTQTWNAEKFQWEETKTVESVDDQTAKFTLTNYSSKAVKANVAFAVEEGLEDTLKNGAASFDKNDITIEKSKSETITATLSFNADAFAELPKASEASTYGKYTVTISSAVTTYAININLSNATADAGNATTINTDGTVTLTYMPTGDYSLPTSVGDITVEGATIDSWTPTNDDGKNTSAKLVINNPTDDVTVTITSGNVPTISQISWDTNSQYTSNAIDVSITATGEGTLEYQWYFRTHPNKPFVEIEKATSNSYSQTNLSGTFVATTFDYYFKCRVSNKYGFAESPIWHTCID